MQQNYPALAGKATVNNGSTSAQVIAAPGVGKNVRITWGTITITVAATGGGGTVSLKDGSTVILSFPASAVDSHYVELGDDGYPLSDNSALNLSVEGAATNQATAYAVIAGYQVG